MLKTDYFTQNLVDFGASEFNKARKAGEALHLVKKSLETQGFDKTKEMLKRIASAPLTKKSLTITPTALKTMGKIGLGIGAAGVGTTAAGTMYARHKAKQDAELRGKQLRRLVMGGGIAALGAGLGYLAANRAKKVGKQGLISNISSMARGAQQEHLRDMYSGYSAGFASPGDYRRLSPDEQAQLLRIYERNYV